MEGVSDEILFYLVVERRVSHKTGGLVHLDEPAFALVVQEDVNAKDLKAK